MKFKKKTHDLGVWGLETTFGPTGPRKPIKPLNGIKVLGFFGKNIEKRTFAVRHDKNYFYFWKSNIPVINLILGSRDMIEVSQNMSL